MSLGQIELDLSDCANYNFIPELCILPKNDNSGIIYYSYEHAKYS